MFKGSISALITPFDDYGKFDEEKFRTLIEWQILEGCHGLLAAGTTGESPTLTHDEHKRVIELCVNTASGKVPVIAGAGSNNTTESVELSQYAEKCGADAVLVVTPYYNKPCQRGLIEHFSAVARSISIPLIIYNIPSRSIINLDLDSMTKLYGNHDNIVGVKDATAKVELVSEQRIAMGSEFIQLSGDDASALGFMVHGGVGCISVTANVAPRLCAEFQNACLQERFYDARVLHEKLMPLHKALFVEPNPGGIKFALSLLGKASCRQRLPLVPLKMETQTLVRNAMIHAGLIN